MGSKKKQTTTYNNTQTTAPASWVAPGLSQVGGMVTDALGQIQNISPYTGEFVATRPQDELDSILALYDQSQQTAAQMQDFLTNAMTSYNTQQPTFGTTLPTAEWIAPDPMDLTDAVNAAVHPVRQNLLEEILPSIKSSALESGAYTGDRAMGVVPGQAIAASDEAMQRIAAEMAYNDYQARTDRDLLAFNALQDRLLGGYQADTERQLGLADVMTSRMQTLPDLAQAIMLMSTSQGDLERLGSDLSLGNSQAFIDNELAKLNYAYNEPFMGLDTATALLRSLGDGYGTTTSSGKEKTVTKTGGAGPIIGGLAGIAGMALGIPGVGAALGIPGMAGAAASAAPLASSVFTNPGLMAAVNANLPPVPQVSLYP